MKNQILNPEKIEATNFSMEANILTLSSTPAMLEQTELFGNDESIILEF